MSSTNRLTMVIIISRISSLSHSRIFRVSSTGPPPPPARRPMVAEVLKKEEPEGDDHEVEERLE